MGARYVGDPIPFTGYIPQDAVAKHRLVLQLFSSATHRWTTRTVQDVPSGVYRFTAERAQSPGSARYRTALSVGGKHMTFSNAVTVEIVAMPAPGPSCTTAPGPTTCPEPPSIAEQRTVHAVSCPRLLGTTHAETRTVRWRWDRTARQWVRGPSPWLSQPGSEIRYRAGVADCVRLADRVPAGAVLPDLRIKDLTKCGRGDALATHGTCFMIVPSAPYDPDFPQLQGLRLLKFSVITLNAGPGPAVVVADRSAADASTWTAYQSFYGATGTLLGSVVAPTVQFYFAGDGHEHWHVRDFDEYDLLDARGTTVARAEKHGYCMQDSTTFDPMQGQPGVPSRPVFLESTSCGKALTKALTIIHGLSRGWGDTYPTSLPDQAIDITGLPDGRYTVQVHADALGAVRESDEANNTAQVKVQIRGDKVTVIPGSAAGGI